MEAIPWCINSGRRRRGHSCHSPWYRRPYPGGGGTEPLPAAGPSHTPGLHTQSVNNSKLVCNVQFDWLNKLVYTNFPLLHNLFA